jgi:hypothetical protein
MIASLKVKLGCWLNERWRLEWVLRAPGWARRRGVEWQDLCNRREVVAKCEDGMGRVCDWKDSSFLTVGRLFPSTGGRLLRHAWSGELSQVKVPVSVILPVRGKERFEAVVRVANALRGMAGHGSEVLLCEHAAEACYRRDWPDGIRHILVQAAENEGFNKSKALNAGALAARNPILLLHDADVLPPSDYVARGVERMVLGGWEAVRPIRLLFMLDREQTQTCLQTGDVLGARMIRDIQENNPGLSTFVQRSTYMEVGGHDERFEGWGGEDLEFLDRLQTRRLYPGAFLPAVHLWHAPAEQKSSGHRNARLLESILSASREQRMDADRKRLEAKG